MSAADFPEAIFPLGGIGTGNISIGARGELRDLEIANHPDKAPGQQYTGFAISVQPSGGARVTRVLEERHRGSHNWEEGAGFQALASLPRLDRADVRGDFPFVHVAFHDGSLPVRVELEAFTPFVPLDAEASGMPCAVFRYRVANPLPVSVDATVAGTFTHVAGRNPGYGPWPGYDAPQTAEWMDRGGIRGILFGVDLPADDLRYGTLALATTDPSTTSKPRWLSDYWADAAQLYWDDLSADGRLTVETRLTLDDRPSALHSPGVPETDEQVIARLPRQRTGSLGIVHDIPPGETRVFEFLVAWSFPNRARAWNGHIIPSQADDETVRNHYATRWPDAWSAAADLAENLPELDRLSRAFRDAMERSTLPPDIMTASTRTISTLRSTTCFRLEDGTFAAWEGSFAQAGSCEGTCTHVWSYAQTAAWLFPELERSARRIEFLGETDEAGAQRFRSNAMFGLPSWQMQPAVDGQLGTIIRLHREWRISGDDAFLRELWPSAGRAMDYVLREWDADGDGLLDAEMHNTYDIEFQGIEPLSNIMLLAALAASARMAAQFGDERADGYLRARDRTAAAVEATLFTGEHYVQRIADPDSARFQYGTGVLSDQLLGSFHAHLNGLDTGLNPEHVRRAIRSVFRHNFRTTLRDHASAQRTFALGDEAGLLLATWPHGGRPVIPFIYADEVWTGIEYQVAAELAFTGQHDAAIEVVRAVNDRHDGRRRSPWNDIECGNHYARSLAAWGLVIAFSGVHWDAPTSVLELRTPGYDGFFSTGEGWGRVTLDDGSATFQLEYGVLDARHVIASGRDLGAARAVAGQSLTIPQAALPASG